MHAQERFLAPSTQLPSGIFVRLLLGTYPKKEKYCLKILLYRTAKKIFFEKENRRQEEMNMDFGKRDIKSIQKSLKMMKIAQQKNEMLVIESLESIKSSHENTEMTEKVLPT